MIRFTLNGTQIEVQDGENRTLLEYLRNVKCMKGTKEACSTGHCGACSVLVDGRLTRSCVTLVHRLDGKAVETIENAPNDTMLQVIQHSFLDVGAVQCGFCTPGMVMATKALLLHHPAPTEPEICDGLKNNYCRCTGYVKLSRRSSWQRRGCAGKIQISTASAATKARLLWSEKIRSCPKSPVPRSASRSGMWTAWTRPAAN